MIKIGEKLPEATFRQFTAEGPKEIKASEFFNGRKVVLFAVVGAFTGTCNNQLPTFVENAGAIKDKGVAEIACTAVNDMFVMDAWSKQVDPEGRVTMLSDGNAEFAKAIGATLDGSGHGLGTRSLRYAMIVDDGEVKALELEENPGVCTISDGATILAEL
jgi:peroxiredoxin